MGVRVSERAPSAYVYPLLIKQLEYASNRSFADHLTGVLLPAWLPADIHVDAEVVLAAMTPVPAAVDPL